MAQMSLRKVVKTYRVKTKDKCNKKEGYWYKEKCWANFNEIDDHILKEDIDSITAAQYKVIKTSKLKLNGIEHSVGYFTASEEEDKLVFITVFSQNNNTEKSLLLFFEDNFEFGEEFEAVAIIFKGNVSELLQEEGESVISKNQEVSGMITGVIYEGDDLDAHFEGEIDGVKGKMKLVFSPKEALLGSGDTKLEIKNNEAYLKGTLGTVTYIQIKELIAKHPEVKTLVLLDVPGSMNDAVNMHTGRLVRENGFTTKLLNNSVIASGGVDLFCAGVDRIVSKGAKLGVHSWSDSYFAASDLPKDHPAHQYQLDYFSMCLGESLGADFYFYTLSSASFEDIYWMSDKAIKSWKIATVFIEK
ncbi:MAG: hypothetical protein JXQ93_02210 [Flavobacteriaceae bacterium]